MSKNPTLPPITPDEREAYIARLRAWNDARVAKGDPRRRAFVLTFGCQQNEADSEKLAGMAKAAGYDLSDRPEDADLILVNTCAIREHAEKKALSTIGQYKHIRAKNPELIIGVCGCMTAQEHRREELKQNWRDPKASALYWAHHGLVLKPSGTVRAELRQVLYQTLMLEAVEDARFAPKALEAMREAYVEMPTSSLKDTILRFRAKFAL